MNRSIKLAAAAVWGSLLCAQVTPPAGGGSGTVTSITLAGTSNQITATGTCTGATTITCTLSIPSAFVLPGTIDGLTITTTTGTLTVASGKTLTASKTLTFDGTDGVTLTFPATSATIARTDAGQTFTGTQTFSSPVAGSVTGNAATATALAANGTNCTAGNYPLGVDAAGNAESCTAAATGTVTSIATTGPITGGTITGTGTIACATCGVTGSPLSQFASTTSSQLAGVISDETGTGVAVFGTSPTLTTPAVTTNATVTNAGLGAVSTDGLTLTNTTAAAAGAQQWSPRFHLTGQGWKTTATAASQSADWIAELQPVQGTTHPTSLLSFSASVAGGAYAPYLTIQGDGINAGAANFTTGTTVTAAGLISGNAGGALQFSAGGWTALTGLNSTTGGLDLGQGHGVYWASGNTNQAASGDTSFCREGAGLVQVSAGTCNTTTAANYRDLKLRHALASGTAPTLSAGTGTIAGADEGGRVTLSAGSQTSITVAFGTAYATNIPACTANDETTATLVQAVATLSTLVLNGSFGAADKVTWTCRGYL